MGSCVAGRTQQLTRERRVQGHPTPKGVTPISSKPVMQIKFNEVGTIERCKLRIVARGFVQKKGVDLSETFAPVANLKSIHVICTLAAKYNLELDQMDISMAYLNGVLDEELYLTPPKGMLIPEGHCWCLKRLLYGLKQAGQTWNKTFDNALTGLGFEHFNAETCLYVICDGPKVCFMVSLCRQSTTGSIRSRIHGPSQAQTSQLIQNARPRPCFPCPRHTHLTRP